MIKVLTIHCTLTNDIVSFEQPASAKPHNKTSMTSKDSNQPARSPSTEKVSTILIFSLFSQKTGRSFMLIGSSGQEAHDHNFDRGIQSSYKSLDTAEQVDKELGPWSGWTGLIFSHDTINISYVVAHRYILNKLI